MTGVEGLFSAGFCSVFEMVFIFLLSTRERLFKYFFPKCHINFDVPVEFLLFWYLPTNMFCVISGCWEKLACFTWL